MHDSIDRKATFQKKKEKRERNVDCVTSFSVPVEIFSPTGNAVHVSPKEIEKWRLSGLSNVAIETRWLKFRFYFSNCASKRAGCETSTINLMVESRNEMWS